MAVKEPVLRARPYASYFSLSFRPGCEMVFGAPLPGLLLAQDSEFGQRRIFPPTLVPRKEGRDLEGEALAWGEGLYLPA